MADGNLNTTNILLGIMAAVSVLQALVLIGVGVFAFRLYRQALLTIREIEQRQVAPLAAHVHALMARVDAIVGDVKDVTGRVTRQTERVDTAIHHTMHRVDETADRVRDSIGSRISQLMRLVHGVICAVQSLFTGRRTSTEAPAI
jgi:methyl-accepting chemotaxis protein